MPRGGGVRVCTWFNVLSLTSTLNTRLKKKTIDYNVSGFGLLALPPLVSNTVEQQK